MQDTRARLRQERRAASRSAIPMIAIGFVIGFLLGFSGQAVSDFGFGPGWFWAIVCFGLGAVAALLGQRLLRSDRSDNTVESSEARP